jgi:hypothetical protein
MPESRRLRPEPTPAPDGESISGKVYSCDQRMPFQVYLEELV